MVKKHNPKPLTKADLYTVINLRKQGLNAVEIGLLTGLNFDEVEHAFYHSDRLKARFQRNQLYKKKRR
jgi:hypothetical protein